MRDGLLIEISFKIISLDSLCRLYFPQGCLIRLVSILTGTELVHHSKKISLISLDGLNFWVLSE